MATTQTPEARPATTQTAEGRSGGTNGTTWAQMTAVRWSDLTTVRWENLTTYPYMVSEPRP